MIVVMSEFFRDHLKCHKNYDMLETCAMTTGTHGNHNSETRNGMELHKVSIGHICGNACYKFFIFEMQNFVVGLRGLEV